MGVYAGLTKAEMQVLLEAINSAQSCTSEDSLRAIVLSLGQVVEFENSALAFASAGPGESAVFDAVNVNFPYEFAEQYIMRRLHMVDPSVARHLKHFGLAHWSGFSRVPELRSLYGDFGIKEAYVHGMPLHGREGAGSFLCISGSRVPRSSRTELVLDTVMPHLHQCLRRVIAPGCSGQGQEELTPRELEVLKWIASGKCTWDISVLLGISERTVNFHAGNIVRKLDASNRVHAVAIAVESGLVTLGPECFRGRLR
jgi:DNA-binding CsgD family transcriptional regulator